MITNSNYDALFAGVMGQDYDLLKLLSPLALEMSRLVGLNVAANAETVSTPLKVIELGSGTGFTTSAILSQHSNLFLLSVDNEPVMQNQAIRNLSNWVEKQILSFSGDDALTALKAIPTASVDVVASAYTLHNFLNTYRTAVYSEILRVLKPNGQFINGDRYALDDISSHTLLTQAEVSGYFKVLIELGKLDVLENWIIHIMSDESADHIMRETTAINELASAGFVSITINHRQGVNALLTAKKPA